MKKTIIIIVISIFVLALGIGVYFLIPKNKALTLKTDATVGVWWWDDKADDRYLEFAKNNGVDEIYYCDYSMDKDTSKFVEKAKQKGMKVFALWGECEWVLDKSGFDRLMNKYEEYQQNYPAAAFEGVHLDVEPHQLDEFDDDRPEIMKKYVEFVTLVVSENEGVKFDFDIPFWAHDIVEVDGKTKPVYAHVIDNANRAFVMSYRDTAEQIVDIAKEELVYAKNNNKTIALGVEMTSNEGDKVSFQEESKQVLYSEISKLDELVDIDYVLSVHHIKTWESLKEE